MTAFLFHSDAIAELLRAEPRPAYVEWLRSLPREEQFTSAVSMAEVFGGADAMRPPDRHLREIEERVLPAVTVLPFDVAVARLYADLMGGLAADTGLSPPEVQVAATALHHGLTLVTSRTGSFRRIPGLDVRPVPRGTRR